MFHSEHGKISCQHAAPFPDGSADLILNLAATAVWGEGGLCCSISEDDEAAG